MKWIVRILGFIVTVALSGWWAAVTVILIAIGIEWMERTDSRIDKLEADKSKSE